MDNSTTKEGENIFKTPVRRATLLSVRRNDENIQKDMDSSLRPIKRSTTVRKPRAVPKSEPTKCKKSKDILELEEKFQTQMSLMYVTDDYFNMNADKSKRLKSSNKTMASLGARRLTPDQASAILKKLDPPFCAAEIASKVEELKLKQFPRMMVQLMASYNIILYGFGSKMKLLESFHQKYLLSENCVVVPGFLHDININMVLSKVIDTYLPQVKIVSRNVMTMAETIRDFFQENVDKLYLIIHNIDGPSLRNSANIFGILTQSQGIQIIASVDHVQSGLMWTETKFDWLWNECTTMEPYLVETRTLNARLMCDKVQQGMSSLMAVISSLNSQAKAVFLHLAKYQLEHPGSNQEGMCLDRLYLICKDHLLVDSETALRTHLVEFKDHRLVSIKPGENNFIKILLDEASIRDFVDNFSQ